MGAFYLYDDNGLFQGAGHCIDGQETLQAREGIHVGIGEPPLDIAHPTEPVKGFEYYRKEEYPSTGAQLDMLWHAMDEGILPKVTTFYDGLKAVKDKYEKL